MTYSGQPARPTTYRGIRMRSRMEAKVAAVLDDAGTRWTYEPRAFANEHGQYLPDFALHSNDGSEDLYIETRPTLEGGYLAMVQMQVIWDSEPAPLLVWVFPEGVAFMANAEDRKWRVVPG